MAGSRFRVTLLGTGAPPPLPDRFGPSTLIEAGGEKLLVDAGRGAMQRLWQLGIPFREITGLLLTHLHSDHVVGLPDLWLTGWIGREWGMRSQPLRVWGPRGTRSLAEHLMRAYEIDLRVRSRHYPASGAELEAAELSAGDSLERGGVRITAFEVDHGSEELVSFGYRFEHHSHTAVLSGDTTFTENLIRNSRGVDLLVHEVAAAAPRLEAREARVGRILRNHTTPEQAGEVFRRTSPRLAVFTHFLLFGGMTEGEVLRRTAGVYDGNVVAGRDLLAIEVGEEVRPLART
jgi:ribonuclease Z